MRVFKNIEELPTFKNSIVTIGTFDGVHLGHQKIIHRIVQLAKEKNGESIIITFFPHPRLVIDPQNESLKMLNTIDERIHLLEKFGIDNLVVVPFSRTFSELRAEDYVADFLVKKFHPACIVIGYDHRFGLNRLGDFYLLEKMKTEFHYELEEISAKTLHQNTISSTKIRTCLKNGEIEEATKLLGYHYLLEGTIVKGKQNGRKLGYPTANIQVADQYKLIPKVGIYAVKVIYDHQEYGGLLSIGFNPTFGGTVKTIEVNILQFNKEIYGEKLTLKFIKYIRDEKKFDSLDSLIKAIDHDKEVIEAVLADFDTEKNMK